MRHPLRQRTVPNNGVVPQQASYAVALLLADLSELVGPGTWEAAA
jgi:hypothetical protein